MLYMWLIIYPEILVKLGAEDTAFRWYLRH